MIRRTSEGEQGHSGQARHAPAWPAAACRLGYRRRGQGADLGWSHGSPRLGQGGGFQRPDLVGAGQAGGAGADRSEPQCDIHAECHARRHVAGHVREDLQIQQPVPLAGGAAASFPLRDHLHQAVMGGHVLAGVPGGIAQLAGHPRHVPALGFTPLAQRLARHIGHRTHPRVPGETAGSLARSGSLRFAPSVSAVARLRSGRRVRGR